MMSDPLEIVPCTVRGYEIHAFPPLGDSKKIDFLLTLDTVYYECTVTFPSM
jgi:hypothetical protein